MKKLSFFAILIANSLFGQISLTSFSFLSKNKTGEGVGVFCTLPNTTSIGLQFKNNEVWKVYSEVGKNVTLKTLSVQYSFQDDIPEKTKWFFNPAAGVMAGLGISTKNDQETRMLLQHPYFFGVFLEIGEGLKLSDRFVLTGFVKFEGMAGMLTNRPIVYENASTKGNFIAGLKFYFLSKKEAPSLSSKTTLLKE